MVFWNRKKSLLNKKIVPRQQALPIEIPTHPEPPKRIEREPLRKNVSINNSKELNMNTKKKSFHTRSDFLNSFKKFSGRHRPWDIWSDFITMYACAISNTVDKQYYDSREQLYLKLIRKYSKREQLLFPELVALTVQALDENQEQDFLGSIFMELGLGNEAVGQFFTPYSVCELMASTVVTDVIDKVNENGYITIHDPTCGAGATLIAGINEAKKQLGKQNINFQNHILVSGQDIDYITALMCYIQLSLLGVAGYIKIGNTLSEPMSTDDSLEDYWFTPMYFSNTWVLRRIFRNRGEEDND